jgi:hypothetical protein
METKTNIYPSIEEYVFLGDLIEVRKNDKYYERGYVIYFNDKEIIYKSMDMQEYEEISKKIKAKNIEYTITVIARGNVFFQEGNSEKYPLPFTIANSQVITTRKVN